MLSEADVLQRAGYDVALIARHTDEEAARPLHALRAATTVLSGHGPDPTEDLRGFRPDIVHVHNLFPNFGRSWVRHIDVSIVCTLHNYRPLCANGLLYRDGGVCTLCPDGARWSGVQHACYRGSRLASLPLAWANRRGPTADPLLARADRVIVLSELQREIYASAGLPTGRMLVWPNFLPDSLDPGDSTTATTREGWLFVGRLSVEKGVLELVRDWPASTLLRVAGSGPLERELHVAARGKRVQFLGNVDRPKVLGLLRESVGLVFSSRWFEGFPLVYLEALAAGTPVLAFEPSVVARLVVADGTGAVARPEDLTDHGLSRLARSFEPLHPACRAALLAHYSEAAFVRRFGQLLSDVGVPGAAESARPT